MQGKEGESDSQRRGDIFPYILKFKEEAQPKAYILENAKALVSARYQRHLKPMITDLKGDDEYHVFWRVFSPVQVGILQNQQVATIGQDSILR